MACLAKSLTLLTLCLFAFASFGVSGCEEKDAANSSVAAVKISGKTFYLEVASDPQTRFRGLSEREHIDTDGGMIFAFPASGVAVQSFVMRDCPNPIDIIYCDGAGHVLTTYTMQPEPPRSEAEKVLTTTPGSPDWTKSNDDYEKRLKRYSSRYASQFVIELKGGTLGPLGVKEGDLVQFDADRLKKAAK